MARNGKYNARRVSIDGYTFDSKAEAARYSDLKLLERAGVIWDLKVHPRFERQPPFTDRGGKRYRAIYYEADFGYHEPDNDALVIEDVKGRETPVFRLKMKWFLRKYPDIDFRIVRV